MENLTPMMKQYFDIKKDYPDTLLFYRLGDFYELFYDDAKIVSKECDLVLTSRSKEIDKTPMCGVPYHSVTPYLQKLLNRGFKIAIVEQMEDPSKTKTIVKREVVRVITPGTMIDEMSDDKQQLNIASIEDAHYAIAISLVEVASGKTRILFSKKSTSKLIPLLLKHNVKEVVVSSSISKKIVDTIAQFEDITLTVFDDIQTHANHERLFDENLNETMKTAIRRLLSYLSKTQFNTLEYLMPFIVQDKERVCELDYTTIYNLDLTTPSKNNKNQMTLFSYLDQCKTAMGSRLLKQWIVEPLQNKDEILQRQHKIGYFVQSFMLLDEIQEELKQVYDLERIATKIAFKRVLPNDLLQLLFSLEATKKIHKKLSEHEPFEYFSIIDALNEQANYLQSALELTAPATIKEGRIFKEGYNNQLDHFRNVHQNGKDWLIEFEKQEKERTQIKNLKIGYNRVFGYFIEISKGNLSNVKDSFGYIRKQTLVNAERFISPELKEKEDELLHAKEKANALEEELFLQLIEKLQPHIGEVQRLADQLATLDVIASLAKISASKRFVAPTFNNNNTVKIVGSFHPLLEKINPKQKTIANDWIVEDSKSLFVLTGPNMGGKSTYMRQIALLIIMAQMGCFVPAKEAHLPLFDAIFTRIGASDDILSGQSTFMVEMVEANSALSLASERSLILFDEIGRGTSTYDGMALAQAIIEYVTTVIKAKTIFSTHYHELTTLEDQLESVENLVTKVIEKDGEVTFLYRIKKGKADKSYGVNVANIAKLPESVISRAKTLLKQLETKRKHVQQTMDIVEVNVIPKELESIKDQLQQLDINEMTPIQAMQCLSELIVEAKKVK